MAEQLANSAVDELAAAINGTDDPVTFSLVDASEFPASGNFRVRIDNEILLGVSRTGNSISANRAQEGTTIAEHASGAAVKCSFTKAALEALFTDHEAEADPHTGYQLETEKAQASGYASLDSGGTVPDAQIPAAIARDAEVTSEIATHAAAADPHTVYQKESEKSAASGYASLDGTTRVPVAELGTGTPDATRFLRDDRTWQVPPGAGTSDHGGLTGLLDDDHTQYQKESEKSAVSGYASLDGTTKVPTAELGTGVADNTVFLRGDRAWAASGSGVTDHGALTGLTDDDHTQYQKESEKSAISGYASLGAAALVPTAELGTGVANNTKFLRGDQSWQTGTTVSTVKSPAYAVVYRSGTTYYAVDYTGADLDSGTNPRTVIQTAINSCNTAGGGDVHLVAATYAFTATTPITAKAGVRLKGEGGRFANFGTATPYGTILQASGAMTAMIDATTGDGFIAEQLAFDRNGFVVDAMVYLSDQSQAVVNCSFKTNRIGVDNSNASSEISNARIYGCQFDGGYTRAININNVSDGEIYDNHIEGAKSDLADPSNGGYGIYMSGGGWLIHDNHITGNKGSQSGIFTDAQNTQIYGNYIDTNGAANITMSNTRHMVIGNNFRRSGIGNGEGTHCDAIRITGGSSFTIMGNTWMNNASDYRFHHFAHANTTAVSRVALIGNVGHDLITGVHNFTGTSYTDVGNYEGGS